MCYKYLLWFLIYTKWVFSSCIYIDVRFGIVAIWILRGRFRAGASKLPLIKNQFTRQVEFGEESNSPFSTKPWWVNTALWLQPNCFGAPLYNRKKKYLLVQNTPPYENILSVASLFLSKPQEAFCEWIGVFFLPATHFIIYTRYFFLKQQKLYSPLITAWHSHGGRAHT